MNNKSAVFRVLHYADRNMIETESRLHALLYLVEEELDLGLEFTKNEEDAAISLYSDDVQEAVENLEKHRFVNTVSKSTIGGDERLNYQLTSHGVDKADTLITGTDQDQKIEEICSEYQDYPISNLLSDIRDSDPAHEWT